MIVASPISEKFNNQFGPKFPFQQFVYFLPKKRKKQRLEENEQLGTVDVFRHNTIFSSEQHNQDLIKTHSGIN